MDARPGRNCPLHYRYGAAALAAAPARDAECLYAVGGLYGNPYALRAVLELGQREAAAPTIVFNGDFHWFDKNASVFTAVNRGVLAHTALRGNVETELAGEDRGTGCGCGYPEWVGDAEVERSNRILRRLRETARRLPEERARLGPLPMFLAARVGGLRVGIVHGDLDSLAGWAFSEERLNGGGAGSPAPAFEAAAVRIVASSHTCLPVALEFAAKHGRCALINNGAAGMPNFAGTRFGIVTRIGVTPSPAAPLFGTEIDGVHIDALPLRYDHAAWTARFLADWPAGSEAHASYARRIEAGPDYRMKDAARSGFRLAARAEAAT